jgi:hypothetical protein
MDCIEKSPLCLTQQKVNFVPRYREGFSQVEHYSRDPSSRQGGNKNCEMFLQSLRGIFDGGSFLFKDLCDESTNLLER